MFTYINICFFFPPNIGMSLYIYIIRIKYINNNNNNNKMSKKQHIWHCGECHGDLFVTRKKKGTKYLYCPNCDKLVAYFNYTPLLMALGTGAASFTGGKVIEKYGSKIPYLGKKFFSKKKSVRVSGGGSSGGDDELPADFHLMTNFEKAVYLEQLEKGEHIGENKKCEKTCEKDHY